MKKYSIFSLAFALILLSSPAHAVTLQAGDLIKSSGPAVYYFTGEKRLVFPNDQTYFSWYSNFNSVKTISATDLANITIGGNVTYRPGKFLVKITTDPKVYAIDKNGTLRWIESEQVANTLYGSAWAKQVRDLPDEFFINYKLGQSINTSSQFIPETVLSENQTIIFGVVTAPAPVVQAPPATSTNICSVSTAAAAESISNPTTVVGNGTASSCTADAFESAVQKGGITTFNCGPDPVTITLDHQIKLKNPVGPNKNGDRVIDGGGLVTLSGGGTNRILYQDACEENLGWLNSHCNNSLYPRLVVQNMTFANGKASDKQIGGGAIYSNGGSLKIVNSKFTNNKIVADGPDVAGGAVYATLPYGPVYITNSTFDGNTGANGGAIGGIFASYNITNSSFKNNSATGLRSSGNSGNGGAVYNDGNSYNLNICGTSMIQNKASFLGGAVFYVANDVKGHINIDRSTFKQNPDMQYAPAPGILKPGMYLQTNVSNIKLSSSTFE